MKTKPSNGGIAALLSLLLIMAIAIAGCAGNKAPTAYIDSIVPPEPTQGEGVTFTGHGTDSDGTVVAYRWTSSIDGEIGTSASFTTSSLSVGSHTISFRVQDNNDAWSENVTANVTVAEANQPPTAYIDSIVPDGAAKGETVTFTGHGTDTDGTVVAYRWASDIDGEIGTSASFITSSLSVGNHTISFKVQDNNGAWSEEDTANVIINVFYDFLAKAPEALWYSLTGFLPWPGATNDTRGFACYRTDIMLEDGETYSKVLETHPQWVNNGWIMGDYDITSPIPAGARFKAEVGFVNGATGTDGVKFYVVFYDGTDYYFFPSSGFNATYDGHLDSLDFDLSSIVGKTGTMILEAHAGPSSAQDWAVWVDPSIE